MNFNDKVMEEAKHSKIEILQRKIKRMLEENPKEGDLLMIESDAMKFIHEIEVQQLELEMENEELIRAREQGIIAAWKSDELYDFAPSGYFTLSPQGIIKELNLNGANLLGKERANLINSTFGFFVSDDTRKDFNYFLYEIFTGKGKKICDVTLTDQGSEPIYVSLSGISDPKGEQCYLTAIDITDRKQLEEELLIANKELAFQNSEKAKRADELALANIELVFQNKEKATRATELIESEAKFKNLVWDMQVGVLIQGPQSEILFSNPQALEYLGLNEDQLLGKTSFDPDWNVIHEDGSPFPGNTHPVPQAIATGLPVRDVVMGVYHPVNGNRIWLLVDALPQFNADGNVKQVVCSFIDISRRKRAEEELMESNTKFQSIFENNSAAMAIISPDSTLLMVNDEYCKMSGYAREEVIETSWTKQIPSEDLDRLLEYNRQRLIDPKNAPDKYEFTFYKKNGETGHSYMSVSMFKDMIIASFVDITPRIRAEMDVLKKMDELLLFQHLTVDRELKMIELKKEVNELLKSSGKDEKYRIVE